MTLGPVMLDLEGPALKPEERKLLRHSAAGGVILFSRNFENAAQLKALVSDIHALREPKLLVAVDHEGGRVQRFHGEFTRLPAAASFGRLYDRYPEAALSLAEQGGWLMAAELRAVGVDFSFAPVLDLDMGISEVIGDRAFHRDPDSAARLALKFMLGMRRAGMAAVGKHFPGHGGVAADSHRKTPVDRRRLGDLLLKDLIVFERMIRAGLPAVMPAHVVYPEVDSRPAGFSRVWLKQILRGRLGFSGAIFSDDLCMTGAAMLGSIEERAQAALEAGCDMLLVCNNRAGAIAVLETVAEPLAPVSQVRLMRLHGRRGIALAELRQSAEWRSAAEALRLLEPEPELDLGDGG